MKPRMFIGSSVEGKEIAEYLQLGLEYDVETTIWHQGIFGLSEGSLEALVRTANDFDFAALVLTPDDLVTKRGTEKGSPRDNVVFELGLFMGALGLERTFIVYNRDKKPDLPTDLAGVTPVTFSRDRSDDNLRAAVGPVCTQIKDAIKACGVKAGHAAEAEAPAPAAKSEPPTVVVDAWHRGDYATITEALKAVEPGTQILIKPGLYREGIVIDKPVKIIGDGDRQEIVIESSSKKTVLFQANVGKLTNLTMRQVGGEYFCVDIAQGWLELEDCDISSQGKAGVAIHGDAAPRLHRNRIHDGNVCGVFVYENGQGVLEGNEIIANSWTGVHIIGGNPILRRNIISTNGREGIWIQDKGGGIFEDNDLCGNTKGAWHIAPDCEANVQRRGNKE
jgi:parallel beta-helix repeat protein